MLKTTNKDVKFPYYSGNIFLAKCIGHCSLDYLVQATMYPKERTMEILSQIENAENIGNKGLKRILKQKLYSFTPSVFIPKGYKRKYENVRHYTGLMQLDFDKLANKAEATDLRDHLFGNYKQIVTTFCSPSRKGVKAIMRVKQPKNKDHYKALHKAVMAEMEQYDCFDSATTNAMLPLFLSWDPRIKYRDYSECFEWNEEDWEEPDYVELNEEAPPHHFNPAPDWNESYNAKTVRIFTNKINNISSDGHPQVRSACLILGSRVAAGYISEAEARSMANNLIEFNSYLQKDTSNYKTTAMWCITEGMKNPRYYK